MKKRNPMTQAQKKRRRAIMEKRAYYHARGSRQQVRAKRKASHLLDLIFMPYFWIMDEFIMTLRDMFNVS